VDGWSDSESKEEEGEGDEVVGGTTVHLQIFLTGFG